MGRSYLGCATTACYNWTAQLAYASASLPTLSRLPAARLTQVWPALREAEQRTEASGKPNCPSVYAFITQSQRQVSCSGDLCPITTYSRCRGKALRHSKTIQNPYMGFSS